MEYLKKHLRKETFVILLVILLAISLMFKVFYTPTNKEIALADEVFDTSLEVQESSAEVESTGKLYVDIKGAVKVPGMYEVTSDMRVLNVIDLAGGLTSEADDKQINFAQKVEDQMIVYIPKEGEELSESLATLPSQGNQSNQGQEEDKVNLNQATKEELMTLNGVGEKKAEKIIDYREENGSFQKIEDLKNVNGFGEKSFESLKTSITI